MHDYRNRIEAIHRALGIPASYADTCGMPLQPECADLVETELDVFGRQPLLETAAHRAWLRMKAGAREQGVELRIVSAYRSTQYQQGIVQRKLEQGQALDAILKVNAAPGYSEHHSGRALDIGCPGYPHLSEEFEHSPAYRWLDECAGAYGFSLSFPRDNPFGVLYEPWHWKYGGD